MLGYCRELGVPLEVEVNTSRSAYLQASKLDGGKPVQNRQVEYDTRGHVSELLAKCIKRGALDQELSHDDKEQMLEFLKQYGDLSPDLFYKGSSRAGYKVNPGAGDVVGVPNDTLDMRACYLPSLEGTDRRGRDRLAGDHVSAGRRDGSNSHGL